MKLNVAQLSVYINQFKELFFFFVAFSMRMILLFQIEKKNMLLTRLKIENNFLSIVFYFRFEKFELFNFLEVFYFVFHLFFEENIVFKLSCFVFNKKCLFYSPLNDHIGHGPPDEVADCLEREHVFAFQDSTFLFKNYFFFLFC